DEAANWYEVDKIFGKEARDIVGPEQRDPAFINIKDTTRFARLGHEVDKGAEYSDEITPISYQEKDKPFLFRDFQNQPKLVDPNR
ncbi:MAG: NADH:quinone oxidoreductase chain, partial [Pseudomonadota bacterium]